MPASYDISVATGYKDLVNGGIYSYGVLTQETVSRTRMTSIPQPIYFFPEGVLSSNTTEMMISHNALSGKYNGITYTASNWYDLIEMRYGDYKIKVGIQGEIVGENGYISKISCRLHDDVTTYGGTSGSNLPTAMIENPRLIYFWLCDYIRLGQQDLFFYGGVGAQIGSSGAAQAIDFDTFVSNSMDATWCRAKCGEISISQRLSISGHSLLPTADVTERSSEEGGGDGDLDTDSDTITFPVLPVISGISTGLITMYNPTITQVMQFSRYLWANDVFSTLQKFINSPMDLIISLSIVPVSVPTSDNAVPMKIGGLDTGASAYKVTEQYITFDCGSINVTEFYGSALDYGVYTKISIYLPYIGVRELKTDEIMGGSIQVKYNIDLLTGACVAMIKCTRQMLESVLYTFEGNISAQLPINARDFTSLYASIARGVIDTAVHGLNPVGAIQTAMSVMSSKPNITRAGNISANGGHLNLHKPYLIIERAIQSLPRNAGHYYGFPSNITTQLSSLSGYTEVDHIIESNIHCTDNEWEEIYTLLKEGVYL